jgi:hypothetical protein
MTQPVAQIANRRTLLDLGLAVRDRRRLEAFLAVGSEQLKARWSVVDHLPADAAIADEDAASPVLNAPAVPLLLCRHTANTHGADPSSLRLQVPLQFEDLVCALAATELRLAVIEGEGRPVPAPAPAPRAVVSPTPSRIFEPLPARLIIGHRFRLRRWPNVAVLNAHPDGHRISPFVSSRALTLSELARLSGIPQTRCSEFLALLMTANFLHVEPLVGEVLRSPLSVLNPSSPPSSSRTPAVAAAPAAAPPPGQGKGLLSRLRERLGLAVTIHSDRN